MKPELNQRIGATLRRAREGKGLSLRAAARLIPSMHAPELSRLERGLINASLSRFMTVAEAYGITEAGELLG